MSMQSIPQDKLRDIVGQKLEPGEWVTVDQKRINTFADCTEDHQFIHEEKEGNYEGVGGEGIYILTQRVP